MEEGHYHFSGQLIKRSKGHSSVAAAAYRSGERLVDERTGDVHDYSRRGGVVHSEILTPEDVPEWMHDREELWNNVESLEKRKDAQLAREINFALPYQLNGEQRLELVRNFLKETFVSEGMVADFAIHEPQEDKGDDRRNHHAHVLLSLRMATRKGFYRVKTREWNSQDMLKHWRAQWASYANDALARADQKVRLDHRSYKDRGIDKEPQIHIGRKRRAMADKELEPRHKPLTRKEQSYLSLLAQAPPRQARWMNHPQSPWAGTRRSLMYKKLELGDRMFRNYQILQSVRRGYSMKEQGLRAQMSSARQSKYNRIRAHKRALSNMREVFDVAYKKPSEARVRFQQMVDKHGFEKSYEKLLKKPSIIGARKGSGIFGKLPFSPDQDRLNGDQALKFLAHRYGAAKKTAKEADMVSSFAEGIRFELDKINRKNRQQSERQRKLDNRYNASQLNPSRSRGGRHTEARTLRDNQPLLEQPHLTQTRTKPEQEMEDRTQAAKIKLERARDRDRYKD